MAKKARDLDAAAQKAFDLYNAGAFAEAADLCSRVLHDNPRYPRIRWVLGVCQYYVGQFGRAAGIFRGLVSEDNGQDVSESAWLQMMLGLCLDEIGQLGEAEAALTRSAQLQPKDIRYFHLGRVRMKLNAASAEAEQAFRRAIELDPSFRGAMYELGVVLRLQHRYEEAAACLKRAAELGPHSRIFTELGWTFADMGQYEAAKEALSCALQLDPNDVRAHVKFAVILMDQGLHNEEQEQHLKRVVELDPGGAETHDVLANLYERQGKLDDAAFQRNLADLLRKRGAEVCLGDSPMLEPPPQIDRGVNRPTSGA